jgi:hypothetical protein
MQKDSIYIFFWLHTLSYLMFDVFTQAQKKTNLPEFENNI